MKSTTISKAKLITTTIEDFESGTLDQSIEAAKVRKQLRFIRDLYSRFPDAVVAGGCPLNHLYGVAAKDIDIFVRSEDTANAILSAYTTLSCVPLGDKDKYQESSMKSVYEAYIAFGEKPVYKLHLNIIVMAETSIDSSVQSRLALGKRVVEHFPLRCTMGWYSEVYGQLTLVLPQQVIPMRPQRPCDKAYSDRVLRKGLLLSALGWRRSRSFRNPTTAAWLSQDNVWWGDTGELRTCNFIPVTKDNNLAKTPVFREVLRERMNPRISTNDVMNLMWMNDYATAHSLYTASSERPTVSSTLAQQARDLVSALWTTSSSGATVSRSPSQFWIDTGGAV